MVAHAPVPAAPEPGFITGVLDSLQLEICVVDAHGNVIAWNRGLERRVAPRAEVLGRPIEEVLARFTRPEWGVDWAVRIRAEVLGAGGAFEIRRYPQRGPAGALLLCDVRVDPIRDGRNRPVGAVLSMRDVTDTARLEVESVRRAKAQELAQLGASVAHEIRNPLNSIGMNAQLLREEVEALVQQAGGGDGDGVVATADLIVREIKRLNGV
ncbi:MAG: histidine kinase dimerization/phospho-acceptor domain-containing protein [Planctomycetota bacterium]|jgi:PAS domain S-box-containing protein